MKQKDHASLFEDDLSCMHEERVYKKAEVPQKKLQVMDSHNILMIETT